MQEHNKLIVLDNIISVQKYTFRLSLANVIYPIGKEKALNSIPKPIHRISSNMDLNSSERRIWINNGAVRINPIINGVITYDNMMIWRFAISLTKSLSLTFCVRL